MRPNNYLSYSQYSTFLRCPKEYIDVYVNGNRRESKYMDFGKMIAYSLEDRMEKACIDAETARSIIEEPKELEKKIMVDFYGIPLYGILDGYNPGEIKEYKTGKNGWTQARVDKDEQLTFYAIMVSISEKLKPEDIKIELTWLETYDDIDGEIHLTGKHKSFQTRRTQSDIIRIYPKIKKVWIGIEELVNSL